MSNMRGWLIAVAACSVLLVSAAGAGYLLLPPRQSSDVALPASGATPEQVVAAYIAALNAHDCDTAEAMATGGAKNSTSSWCQQVASLTDVVVRNRSAERPQWSGRSASVEVVRVPVDFNLDWRPFRSDGSMAEGSTRWGYLLERRATEPRWRIFDQGSA